MDRDELYEALRAAGLTGEQAVVAASVVRNLDPEDLAEVAGPALLGVLQDVIYKQGQRDTAEKIADAFPHEDWCCAKGCPGYGHCPHWQDCSGECRCLQAQVRHVARSYAGDNE